MNDWTDKQKERMNILYELNPKMKTAYLLVNKFRNIMKKKQTREQAKEE